MNLAKSKAPGRPRDPRRCVLRCAGPLQRHQWLSWEPSFKERFPKGFRQGSFEGSIPTWQGAAVGFLRAIWVWGIKTLWDLFLLTAGVCRARSLKSMFVSSEGSTPGRSKSDRTSAEDCGFGV